MKDYLKKSCTTANRVMMLRSQFPGAFLLVEGADDVRLYSNVIDCASCRLILTEGKKTAVEAMIELEKRRFKGVLAIVDADFDILDGTKPGDNQLVTDTHDLDTMLLQSPALEKILKELIPGDKIDHIQGIAQSVRENLVSSGLPFGYLRWVSSRERLGLDFTQLPYDALVDGKSLAVDIDKMIRIVRIAKQKVSLSDEELRDRIHRLQSKSHDPWQVCQGHDLVSLGMLVVPVVLDKHLGRAVSADARKSMRSLRLAESLRLAYEVAFFVKTALYSGLKNWERANQPYRVLNC